MKKPPRPRGAGGFKASVFGLFGCPTRQGGWAGGLGWGTLATPFEGKTWSAPYFPFLPASERRAIGEDIKTVQFGWPLGMPLVRKLAKDLWEIRVHLKDRIARILFTLVAHTMVLLHGFIKKSQDSPLEELDLAKRRLQQLRLAS